MEATILNIQSFKEYAKQFLKNDKKDGVKKAWYFYHREAGQIQAIDEKWQFEAFINTYDIQGIKLDKTINKNSGLGAKLLTLYIFRKEGSVIRNVAEPDISLAVGYLPADCETCILEAIF